jgi:hypothetical protein
MADELKAPLPMRYTGLTLYGKVFSASAQIGSDTAMTEIGTTAVYAASFSLTGVADGEYMVRFDTDTKTYATGKLYVLNQAQVTPEQYALAANLATVDAVVDAIKAVTDLLPNAGALTDIGTGINNLESRVPDTVSLANINAEVDTAFTDYDPPTKAELDTAEANILADIADLDSDVAASPAVIYSYFTQGSNAEEFKSTYNAKAPELNRVLNLVKTPKRDKKSGRR